MITEDYCSYEVAKLLKEKGFDEATNRYYNAQYDEMRTVSDTFMTYWNNEEHMKVLMMEGALAIPTHQMAMKWLREEKNIIVNVWYNGVDWSAEYYNNEDENFYLITCLCDSYEDAIEVALKYCLENLI